MEDYKNILSKLENDFSVKSIGSELIEAIKYPSKKNEVYAITLKKPINNLPESFVVKLIKSDNSSIEVANIKKLKNSSLAIPKILYHTESLLIFDKIEGENMCDFINDNLNGIDDLNELNPKMYEQITLSTKQLANWLSTLHQYTRKDIDSGGFEVLNKGDTRLRDFIFNLSSNQVFGLDFEESYYGNYIDDLAWLSCSLLDTKPGIFEKEQPRPKIELINIFLTQYFKNLQKLKFDFNYFAEKLIEDLNIVIERRELDVSIRKTSVLDKIKLNL